MDLQQIRKEIWFTAVRSRGPGGQNVNRVASAAQLGWSFEYSQGLSPEEKSLVREKMAAFINREHQVFLRSDVSRELEQNKSLCWEKLVRLLERAMHRPKPRRKTKPTKASKQRRREAKSRRSEVKAMRRRVHHD